MKIRSFELSSFCIVGLFLLLCNNADTGILLSEVRSGEFWAAEIWSPDFQTTIDFFVCMFFVLLA